MKTKQFGDGLQHIYESEEELRKAAERLGLSVTENERKLFFHSSTATTQIHLYTKLNEKV